MDFSVGPASTAGDWIEQGNGLCWTCLDVEIECKSEAELRKLTVDRAVIRHLEVKSSGK